MDLPPEPPPESGGGTPRGRSGRYRFSGGKPVDPDEGVHPEMVDLERGEAPGAGIPTSPDELIALQGRGARPEKAEPTSSPRVQQVLELIEQLDTTAREDQQIALALLQQLEDFHNEVVEEMRHDDDASHSQIVAWATDADRLLRSRLLLESVDLE
jgi:hypothetical protein